jgi:capsid protein
VDPELIVPAAEAPDSQGIVTAPADVEQPLYFLKARPGGTQDAERVPAEEMLQTRIGVDSNEKRGVSLLAPILASLEGYEKWMETELLARKLQSSIVLWRKVQGSPSMAEALADQASGGGGREGRRERFAPGSILTTNQATDIQFLQPNTNFGDAVPLGRMLLLSIAAGAGLPEFMLTADASNGNFSSTMVAEGPAVKFFQSEQQFFAGEFTRLWRWTMQEAVELGLLPEDFFEQIEVRWNYPQLVNRDRPKERLADVRLIEAGVLSRSEVGRRDGVDPGLMLAERKSEEGNPKSEARNSKQGPDSQIP